MREGSRRIRFLIPLIGVLLLLVTVFSPLRFGGKRIEAAAPEKDLGEALVILSNGERERAIQVLESLDPGVTPPSLSRRVDFLLGMLYIKEKRWADAKGRLQRASTSYPELSDYSLFYQGEADFQMGEFQSAVRALKGLLGSQQESRWRKPALLRLGEAYLALKDTQAAERTYRSLIKGFPSSAQSTHARLSLAGIALSRGHQKEAASLLREIELHYSSSAEAKSTKRLWDQIDPSFHLQWEDRFRRAEAFLSAERYEDAAQEFRRLSRERPAESKDARRAILKGGVSSFQARDYRGATDLLSPLSEQGSGSGSEEARYWMGRSYLRLGKREEGRFQLLWLTCRSPRGLWSDDALYRLGLDEEGEGDLIQARDTYGRLVETHPESDLIEEVLWHRGWVSYRIGEYASALKDFQGLCARQPQTSEISKYLYWMGRCLERMDQPHLAASHYEQVLSLRRYDYYFFRALNRLAGIEAFPPEGSPQERGWQGADSNPSISPASSPQVSNSYLIRARELADLSLGEEAMAEYGEAISLSPKDLTLVEEACMQALKSERPDRTIHWARRYLSAGEEELGRCLSSNLPCYHYPLGYWKDIQDPAQISGVDIYLILAVIREESAFSPTCISKAGARGLMQLIPSTAIQVASQLGHPLPKPRNDLLSAQLNIRLGTHYLRNLLREFQGSFVLALASYNAGPHATKRWLARHAGLDEEEFTEAIPYSETRAYVKKVMRSYEVYKLVYEERG